MVLIPFTQEREQKMRDEEKTKTFLGKGLFSEYRKNILTKLPKSKKASSEQRKPLTSM